MNEDRILEMFFEKARWQYAIEKGLFKDMNKAVMYQLTTPEARLAMYQRIQSDTSRRLMTTSTTAILEHSDSTSVATYRTNGILTRCARLLASIRIPGSWRSRKCSMCVTSTLMRATSFLRTCIFYSADGLVSGWITATDSRRRILSLRVERLLRKEHAFVPGTAQSA